MVDKELAKALLKAVPGAEKVVRTDGCIFVFCKKYQGSNEFCR